MKNAKEIKQFVKDHYASIASNGGSCCSCCSCNTDIAKQAQSIGYSEAEIRNIPEGSVMGLGCGNPTALAELKAGETVLDLGSGGGVDVFLAAQKVGENGVVIGVDMTSEMLEKARGNARLGNYKNVEFRSGEIENLPVEDDSIDVVISNCVVNLSPDKLAAYKEVFRVLKPDGRVLISDIVTEGELPDDIRQSFDAWTECIAGAVETQEYLDTITKAGFRDVTVVAKHPFCDHGMDDRLAGKIVSIQIQAYK
ncbi:MAG: methyltransferase domain-containing protein [Methanosarcinales archaeon]|nr:MAG: methyltransferase domain-containing protein [Methanosarcinales archaeon]